MLLKFACAIKQSFNLRARPPRFLKPWRPVTVNLNAAWNTYLHQRWLSCNTGRNNVKSHTQRVCQSVSFCINRFQWLAVPAIMRSTLPYPDLADCRTTGPTRGTFPAIDADDKVSGLEDTIDIGPLCRNRFLQYRDNGAMQPAYVIRGKF